MDFFFHWPLLGVRAFKLANSPWLTFWQIESGQADVDERDTTGATPAHYAAAQGKRNNVLIINDY